MKVTAACSILLFSFLLSSSVLRGQALETAANIQMGSGQTERSLVGLERVFPQLRFHRPVFLTGSGDDRGRLFVVEQDGVIHVFDQRSEHPTPSVFLDIRDRISRKGNEEGLIGLAFHPDFKTNGRFYVHYSSKRDQADAIVAPNVLAEFRVSKDNPNVAESDSEQVLLVQPQPYANHNGGMIAFGADGYLYVSLGDGGNRDDPHSNGQNVQTLLGAILRIDVDQRDGNIPVEGSEYSIPADNPFLGTPGAKPELWAIGLRNVWRFSFDRDTGDLWAADVGQEKWEEVNIIRGGGNYGWNRMEADSIFRAETALATQTDDRPVAIYGHQWGGSITGGYVYRGRQFPELVGSYFYGDYMTGNLWQVSRNEIGDYESELVRRTGRSIASFGEDDDGELYVLSFDGGIYRLQPTAKPEDTFDDWPENLAETGLFTSVPNQQVADHLIPYRVNAPFWSDNAEKSRYIALPAGRKMDYRRDGSWSVPVGTTIVKNFAWRTGRRRQMLETRLIKRTENGWESATYVWDRRNTSAELKTSGKQFEIWNRGDVKSWHAPSSSECSACHVEAAGYVLGLTTAQLNGPGESSENQIENWAKMGYLDLPADFDPETAARYCSTSDESCDLETRARVWMEVNCAMCHRPLGPGNANIDLRYQTVLEQTGMINEKPAQGNLGIENAMLVAPGDPKRSLLLHRVKTLGAGRMPNIGSNQIDEEGVKLLTEWIQSLPR